VSERENTVSFAITPEQIQLRDTVRRFLVSKSASADVRRLMATTEGYDPELWRRMATELGLHGLAIPEQYGGAGFGLTELALVFEEMGRALLVAPFLSTVALAAPLLIALDDEAACAQYLPEIADGSLLATVAISEPAGRWEADAVTCSATPSGADWLLDGVKTFVLDGHVADLLLVLARAHDGELGVFAVAADAPGLSRTPLETLDPTRKLARVELAAVPARRIGPADVRTALTRTLEFVATALAAEQTGGAERCLHLAVEYAKVREQFGRPIGSFQAIKHKCADMLMSVESARSAAYYAAWTADAEPGEFPRAAAVAKAYCSDAYLRVAAENIQIHGGIGFTWEHDAHLYFRRAKSTQHLFGDPRHHRARVLAEYI
jgi:alkylation response protein AidB-like acyl-CoA dehydrogenase